MRHQDHDRRRIVRQRFGDVAEHADANLVGVGKALHRGVALARVDHHHAPAQRLGHRDERHGDVARAEDVEGGRGRVHLDERLALRVVRAKRHRARAAALEPVERLLARGVVERVVTEGTAPGAVAHHDEVMRASAVEHRDERRRPPDARLLLDDAIAERQLVGIAGQRHGLDEDVHDPAAGEAEVPGIFIGHGNGEQRRASAREHRLGLGDHPRVHAAADRHRAEDSSVGADPHLGTLLPRRGALHRHQGGHGDALPRSRDAMQLIERLTHA